jgi:hypothetical protein
MCVLNLSFNKGKWTCAVMSSTYEAMLFLSRATNTFWKQESTLTSGSYSDKYSFSITDKIHIMHETSLCYVLGMAELFLHYCIGVMERRYWQIVSPVFLFIVSIVMLVLCEVSIYNGLWLDIQMGNVLTCRSTQISQILRSHSSDAEHSILQE